MNLSPLVTTLPPFLRRHSLVQLMIALFPSSRVQTVRFNGSAHLLADLTDASARQHFLSGIFEPEFFEIAAPLMTGGGAFFDVGANFGFCSFGLMDRLAGAAVPFHLFEANRALVDLLIASCALYPDEDVTIIHGCVSDRPGSSRLACKPEASGEAFVSADGELEAPNVLLDEYVADRRIERIRLLKMDIEGHEPYALRGAREALGQGIVETVYMEVSTAHLERAASSADECLDILRQSGFRLFYCKPSDFGSGIADASRAFSLPVAGSTLRLAPVGRFARPHQTDILAIHRSSELMASLPPDASDLKAW